MTTRLYMKPDGTPAALVVNGAEVPNVLAVSANWSGSKPTTIEVAFSDSIEVLPVESRNKPDSGLTVVTLGGEQPIG